MEEMVVKMPKMVSGRATTSSTAHNRVCNSGLSRNSSKLALAIRRIMLIFVGRDGVGEQKRVWLTCACERLRGCQASHQPQPSPGVPVLTSGHGHFNAIRTKILRELGGEIALRRVKLGASAVNVKAEMMLAALRPSQFGAGVKRLAVCLAGEIPIPISNALRLVPLKILSYCSIFRLVLKGERRMRRNVAPVTASHTPKRAS